MASILEFRKEALGSGALGTKGGPKGPAEIILFPGVRYERMTDSEPAAQTPRGRRGSRRRDRIDLEA